MTQVIAAMPTDGLADPGTDSADAPVSSTNTGTSSKAGHEPDHSDAADCATPAPSLPQLTLSILERGWGLISAPGGFHRGSLYRGCDIGTSIDDATCFCSVGAVTRASREAYRDKSLGEELLHQVHHRAEALLSYGSRRFGYQGSIVEANDDGGWPVVEKMWAHALRLARDAAGAAK